MLFGDTFTSAIGSMFSSAAAFVAANAQQTTLAADQWEQSTAGVASQLLDLGSASIPLALYSAPSGRAAGTKAAFWGNPIFEITALGDTQIPNLRAYRAMNAGGSASLPLVSLDGNNIVNLGDGGALAPVRTAYVAPYAASAVFNGVFLVDSGTPGQFVFYAGGARYKLVGTAF
jgi:hypothetical protein